MQNSTEHKERDHKLNRPTNGVITTITKGLTTVGESDLAQRAYTWAVYNISSEYKKPKTDE